MTIVKYFFLQSPKYRKESVHFKLTMLKNSQSHKFQPKNEIFIYSFILIEYRVRNHNSSIQKENFKNLQFFNEIVTKNEVQLNKIHTIISSLVAVRETVIVLNILRFTEAFPS